MTLRLDTIIYPDGSEWTLVVELDRQNGTIPDELITWRGEPSSYTSNAPELHTEAASTPCEWYGD